MTCSPPARLSRAVSTENVAGVLHELGSNLQGFDAFGAAEEVLFELFPLRSAEFAQKALLYGEYTDRLCVVHG
jgi:hypothetical protein